MKDASSWGANAGTSLFAQLGGTQRLREIIGEFVDVMYRDRLLAPVLSVVHIDYIKEMEYQYTAEFLGAAVRYKGRDLEQAHAPFSISKILSLES